MDSYSASDGPALGGLYFLRRWARASVFPAVIIADANSLSPAVIVASPGRNANAGTSTFADATTTFASSVVQCVVHESELWSDPAGSRTDAATDVRKLWEADAKLEHHHPNG